MISFSSPNPALFKQTSQQHIGQEASYSSDGQEYDPNVTQILPKRFSVAHLNFLDFHIDGDGRLAIRQFTRIR